MRMFSLQHIPGIGWVNSFSDILDREKFKAYIDNTKGDYNEWIKILYPEVTYHFIELNDFLIVNSVCLIHNQSGVSTPLRRLL